MSCDEKDCPKNPEKDTPPPSQSDMAISQEKNLSSRKFIAFLLCLTISLGVFLLVYFRSNDIHLMDKFLNIILWLLVAYIGGNSAERLTDKLGGKNE